MANPTSLNTLNPSLRAVTDMNTIALYFLGRHRCAYFSSETFEDVQQQVVAAIAAADDAYRAYINDKLTSFTDQNRSRYSKISSEYGCWGITWYGRQIDQATSSLFDGTACFPPLPGLAYPDVTDLNLQKA